jgi:hypothetical protein
MNEIDMMSKLKKATKISESDKPMTADEIVDGVKLSISDYQGQGGNVTKKYIKGFVTYWAEGEDPKEIKSAIGILNNIFGL